VEDHCEECGFDARSWTTAQVCAGLRDLPAEVTVVLSGVEEPVLRRRPNPTTWSPVEYLGHMRDAIAYHRFIIEQALAETRPSLDHVDPDAAVDAAGFADASIDNLLGQLDRRVERLCTLVDGLEPAGRTRTVVRSDGSEIDVTFLVRSALHEGRHHTGDIERLTGRGPGG
jgi:hypothetical protein